MANAGEEVKAAHMVLYKKDGSIEHIRTEKYDPYQKEVEYFASCVQKNRETKMVLNCDVTAVLRVLEAIQKSLVKGERVMVR